MTAPLNELGWSRRRPPEPRDPPVWRDPGRLLFLGSAACLVVGSLMPWAVGVDPAGRPDSFRATQGTGEGVWLIATALVLIFLARDRTMWETTNRVVQLLPLLLMLLSVAMWIGADNYARVLIEYWSRGGWGAMAEARYVTAAGIVGTGLGTAWFEWRRSASVRARTPALLVELGVTRWTAASAISAFVLGALGALLAVVLGILLLGTGAVIFAVILAVFGLFIGVGVALRLVGWFQARLHRDDASSAARREERVARPRISRGPMSRG